MLGRENEFVDAPVVKSVHNGPVIAATWNGVLDLLKKKNAPRPLMFLAETCLKDANKAADRLRGVELTPEELAARAETARHFSQQAETSRAAALSARLQAAAAETAPLPAAYHDTAELVAKADTYKPGPRRILLPEKTEESNAEPS